MNADDHELTEASLETLLKSAHSALDGGEVQTGRELSYKVLKAAQTLGSKRFEAKALLCLAHCDRMLSHYRRAHRASQRAAQGFPAGHQCHDRGGVAVWRQSGCLPARPAGTGHGGR